jgi:hypothetical protein
MSRYKKARTWRVTMEHRAGFQVKSYHVAARSGYQAQRVTRSIMLADGRASKPKGKGWHPRYWSMIGLLRTS